MKLNKPISFIMSLMMICSVLIFISCPMDAADGDTTIPVVESMVPIDESIEVALNTTINATFSEEMEEATFVPVNFTVRAGAEAIDGTVSYEVASKVATFTTTANLAANTEYEVLLGTGIKDLAGNSLEATIWTFTTGAAVDSLPPTVISVYPADTATDVAVNDTIWAVFSEGMDLATITGTNFTLMQGLTPVAGKVTYNVLSKRAIFSPTANLAFDTAYTATVKADVKDSAGNALIEDKVWSFTTMEPTAIAGPAPVRLGTAANFVILAKTAITTVPASEIVGDIGLSPAAESYITGFSQTKATGYSTSPQVAGYIYAADMTPPTPINMTVAIQDMEAAYVDAAGRSLSAVNNLGAGTIGGLSFVPGLYHWGSNLLIDSDITLDGGVDDVWIFQTTGNLVISSGVEIILEGGAQAKNIFWQVAGYAQLGTYSSFEGNLLCQTQINVQTDAVVNGRLLAQSQVTLQQNLVSFPNP